MRRRVMLLFSSVAEVSILICIFDIAFDLSSRSFILSCEIVVGSWVGISQVKIKSGMNRSSSLFYCFADCRGELSVTCSSE